MNGTPNLTTVSLLAQYLFRHSNYEHLRHGIFRLWRDFGGKAGRNAVQLFGAPALASKVDLSPALTVKWSHKTDG